MSCSRVTESRRRSKATPAGSTSIFHNEHPLAPLFYYHLRERGIHIQESFPCFMTTAHSDGDFERIYVAFEESLDALQAVGILGTGRAAVAAVAVQGGSELRDVPLTESQRNLALGTARRRGLLRLQRIRQSAAAGPAERRCAADSVGSHRSASRRLTGDFQLDRRSDAYCGGAAFRFLSERSVRPSAGTGGERLGRAARCGCPNRLRPGERSVHQRHPGHIVERLACIRDDGASHHLRRLVDQCHRRRTRANLCGAMPRRLSAYARAQAARDAADLAKTEAFWINEFALPPATLDLPTDRPRPADKSFNGASLYRRIDAKLYQAVKKAGARQGSTLFVTPARSLPSTHGPSWPIKAKSWSACRPRGQALVEDQVLVGHCVNFLPIRGAWTRDTRVAEYLSATAQTHIGRLRASELHLRDAGSQTRSPPRAPADCRWRRFQFNLERLADRIDLPGMTMDVSPNAKAFVNFDLFLNVIESADGLRMDCDYNTDLFDAATVAHWLDCYQALLEAIVADVRATHQQRLLPARRGTCAVARSNERRRGRLPARPQRAGPDRSAGEGDAACDRRTVRRRAIGLPDPGSPRQSNGQRLARADQRLR